MDNKDKYAVILPGGGAKGSFQAAVLHTLVLNSVPIGTVIGTSIGAVNGLVYACGVDPVIPWHHILNSSKAIYRPNIWLGMRFLLTHIPYWGFLLFLYSVEIVIAALGMIAAFALYNYPPHLFYTTGWITSTLLFFVSLICILLVCVVVLGFSYGNQWLRLWLGRHIPRSAVYSVLDLTPMYEDTLPELVVNLKGRLLGRQLFCGSALSKIRDARLHFGALIIATRVENMFNLKPFSLARRVLNGALPALMEIWADVRSLRHLFRRRWNAKTLWKIYESVDGKLQKIDSPPEQLHDLLQKRLDDQEQDAINLVITTADLVTGQVHAFYVCDREKTRYLQERSPLFNEGIVWHPITSEGMLLEAVAASASIPIAFSPSTVEGIEHPYLVDGGINYGALIKIANELGYKRVIVIPTKATSTISAVVDEPRTLLDIGLRCMDTMIYNSLRQEVQRLDREPRIEEWHVIEPRFPVLGGLLEFSPESSTANVLCGQLTTCEYLSSSSSNLTQYHRTPCECLPKGFKDTDGESVLFAFSGWNWMPRLGLVWRVARDSVVILVTTQRIILLESERRYRVIDPEETRKITSTGPLAHHPTVRIKRDAVIDISARGFFTICISTQNSITKLKVHDAQKVAQIVRQLWGPKI